MAEAFGHYQPVVVDPHYFRDELTISTGNVVAVEPILTQFAWFRPHTVSEDVPNLYPRGAGSIQVRASPACSAPARSWRT